MRIGLIGSDVVIVAIARDDITVGMNTSDFLFTDVHGVHAPAFAAKLSANVASSNGSLVHQVDILVLGVKPHVRSTAIKMIAHIARERPKMYVVSLATGCTVESIAENFSVAVPIIRVMLNVNTQIGRSMSVICSLGASGEQVAMVEILMNEVGCSIHIEGRGFPALQVFAGYSPAQVFQITRVLARAGVRHGLTKEISTATVVQALTGSADLALEVSEQGTAPSEPTDKVCSPGGTTTARLFVTRAQGVSTYLIGAVKTVTVRNVEISTHAG